MAGLFDDLPDAKNGDVFGDLPDNPAITGAKYRLKFPGSALDGIEVKGRDMRNFDFKTEGLAAPIPAPALRGSPGAVWSAAPPKAEPASFPRQITDAWLAASQQAGGVVKGLADNINAGDNAVSNAMESAIRGLDRYKSADAREQIALRNMEIYAAEKNGEAAAARAAFNTLFKYPAAGRDVVVGGAGSFAPTIGLSAAGAGLRGLAAFNAASNAGSAAGDAGERLRELPDEVLAASKPYKMLRDMGLDHETAKAGAVVTMAAPAQITGGAVGWLAGRTGLEKGLAGGGANTIRDRAGRAASELTGEIAEELSPLFYANAAMRTLDGQTPYLQSFGRTAVDTVAGGSPAAALSAAQPARPGQAQPQNRGASPQVAPGIDQPAPLATPPIEPAAPQTAAPEAPDADPVRSLAKLIADTAIQPSPLAPKQAAAPQAELTDQDVFGDTAPSGADLLRDATKMVPPAAERMAAPEMQQEIDAQMAAESNDGMAGESAAGLLDAIQTDSAQSNAAEQAQQEAEPELRLPKELAGAKPRYSYGGKQFDLTFESDIDRAAYIAAQATPSARDADYVAFAEKATGQSAAEIRKHGAKVRAAIKAMAKAATPGTLTVPTQYAPKVVEVKNRAPVKKASNTLLQAIINRGGISRDIMQDVGGDPRGRYAPGLFTKTGITDLSELAESLVNEDGFAIDLNSDVGGARELEELIARMLKGERITNTATMEAERNKAEVGQYRDEIRTKAKELGVRTVGRKFADVEAEVLAAEQESIAAAEEEISGRSRTILDQLVSEAKQMGIDTDAMLEEIPDQYTPQQVLDALGGKIEDAINARLSAINADLQTAVEEREPDERSFEEAGGTAESGAGANREAGSAPAGTGGDGAQGGRTQGAGEFDLAGQSNEEIAAAEKAAKEAEAKRQADERAAEQRRQADAERGSFTLTGSDRAADVAAANGQNDLFSTAQDAAAGMSAADVEAGIKRMLGDDVGQALLDAGIISIDPTLPADVQGATYRDGRIVLNPKALDADTLAGVVKHEGFHSTIKELVGQATYDKLMARLQSMLDSGVQWAQDARAAVPSDTKPEHVLEEVGAYAIEQYANGEKQPTGVRAWVESLLSAIRTALIRYAKGRVQAAAIERMQPQDLARLAVAGLKAKAAGMESARLATAYSEVGPFGPVLTGYRGDPQGAIAKLMELKDGEAVGALSHPDIGEIDLVWGEEGKNKHDGYGLAKLAKWHPEVLSDLQGVIESMEVKKRSDNRVMLESADHKGGVRLEWNGVAKSWLLTAFRKEVASSPASTDTGAAKQKGGSLPDQLDGIVDQKLSVFYSRAAQTDTPAFRRWFGDSKVVDADGKPLASISDLVLTRQSAMLEGRPDRSASDSKPIADLLVGKSFSLHGLSGLEVPAQRKVLDGVLAFGDDLKVLRSVIELIPVDVMNILARKNLAPEMLFRDEAVLKELLSSDSNGSVSAAVDVANALVLAVARMATKRPLINARMATANRERRAASDAGVGNDFHDAIVSPIKGIGNNGDFDPNNPDIRYSKRTPKNDRRRPAGDGDPRSELAMPKAPTPRPAMPSLGDVFRFERNPAGRGENVAGRKIYDRLASYATSYLGTETLGKFALADDRPEAFKTMMRQWRTDQRKAASTAKGIAEAGQKLTIAQRKAISALIEKQVAVGDMPPQEIVDLAASITASLEVQARELVELGMLTEDRLVENYLPRLYQNPTVAALENGDMLRATLRKTMMRMRGERMRQRGMTQDFKANQVEAAKKLGWKISREGLAPEQLEAIDQGRTDIKVPMWRDYTKKEREAMGEIDDAIMRYAVGFMETQKDVAIGRLFQSIAGNADLAKTFNPGGWKRVPERKIEGTNGLKAYGKLAGMWVHPSVAYSLEQYTQPKGTVMAAHDKLLSMWKEGKVVWNPVSHGNNIASNVHTAVFAGLNIANPKLWRDTLREYKGKGEYFNEAVEAGLFGNDIVSSEIIDMLTPDLSSMKSVEAVITSRLGKLAKMAQTAGKPVGWYRKTAQKLYEGEDQIFKLMAFMESRKAGATPEQAVAYAERYFFNYNDMPAGIELVKKAWIPFVSYTYRATPMLVHTALTRPDLMLLPAALYMGANMLGYALSGGDEEEERKAMPEYMQGWSAATLTPKAIRLPFNMNDRPAFYDISRRVPMGDLFDVNNQLGGAPIPQPLMPGHPLLSLIAAIFFNEDTFTGKELTKNSDTFGEAFKARVGYTYRQVMPNAVFVPGSYSFNQALDGIASATDTDINLWFAEYTGSTKSGDPVDPLTAALSITGVAKVRSFDPQKQMDYKSSDFNREAREIRANIRSIRRDQSLTDERKEKRIAEQREKEEQLRARRDKELN